MGSSPDAERARISAEERKEALAFVAERLQRFSFSETPRVFSLSARQGLQAKQSGNSDHLKDSGLGSFEDELLRFLTEERAQSFLSNMYGRATTFLAKRLSLEGQAAHAEAYNQLVERLRNFREKSPGARVKRERKSLPASQAAALWARFRSRGVPGAGFAPQCWMQSSDS